MTSTPCMGFAHVWYRTREHCLGFCTLFGVTSSVCYVVFRFARYIFYYSFFSSKLLNITKTTADDIGHYKSNIGDVYLLKSDGNAVADG